MAGRVPEDEIVMHHGVETHIPDATLTQLLASLLTSPTGILRVIQAQVFLGRSSTHSNEPDVRLRRYFVVMLSAPVKISFRTTGVCLFSDETDLDLWTIPWRLFTHDDEWALLLLVEKRRDTMFGSHICAGNGQFVYKDFKYNETFQREFDRVQTINNMYERVLCAAMDHCYIGARNIMLTGLRNSLLTLKTACRPDMYVHAENILTSWELCWYDYIEKLVMNEILMHYNAICSTMGSTFYPSPRYLASLQRTDGPDDITIKQYVDPYIELPEMLDVERMEEQRGRHHRVMRVGLLYNLPALAHMSWAPTPDAAHLRRQMSVAAQTSTATAGAFVPVRPPVPVKSSWGTAASNGILDLAAPSRF